MNFWIKGAIAALLCTGIQYSMATTLGFLTGHEAVFGIKEGTRSQKTPVARNIQKIEQKYDVNVPMVSFIYDVYGQKEDKELRNEIRKLGKGKRVYHISISPYGYTAKQVAEGIYDEQYKRFFKLVKDLKIKVVFRTMHEMNGGRFSRSSDPENFKKAWIHVWELSREAGLTKQQILFSLSYSLSDLPTKDPVPKLTSEVYACTEELKKQTGCPRMEDYYPGDKYVDLVGITLFNRGRALNQPRASRRSPSDIFGKDLIKRVSQWKKPLSIDEVGTTAVDFEGEYSKEKVKHEYLTNKIQKNQRLLELRKFVKENPKIKTVVYFNVDVTNGYKKFYPSELDWSIVDVASGGVYYRQGVKLFPSQKSIVLTGENLSGSSLSGSVLSDGVMTGTLVNDK